MSKVLATHPGRIGDLLWALPTVRALAESYGEKVTLVVPPGLQGVGELVKLQPYIEDVVVDAHWEVQDTAPRTPRIPPPGYVAGFKLAPEDRIFHLGYPSWPTDRLARYTNDLVRVERELPPLDLSRPWITPPSADAVGQAATELGEVSVGFTDEWGELKCGILVSVAEQFGQDLDFEVMAQEGSRWDKEFQGGLALGCLHHWTPAWDLTAWIIANTRVFLGCLSAQAVLAKAMGVPRVLVEPNPHRHHEIFQHPDQGLVLGGDGLPTFDARAVGKALNEKLMEKEGGGL